MKATRQIYLTANTQTLNINLPFDPKKFKILQYLYTDTDDVTNYENKLVYDNENQELILLTNENAVPKVINKTSVSCDITNWNGQMKFKIVDNENNITSINGPFINMIVEFST